jgi:hypothetical protein
MKSFDSRSDEQTTYGHAHEGARDTREHQPAGKR